MMGVVRSMGHGADANDNAMGNCFATSPECELLDRSKFRAESRDPAWQCSRTSSPTTTRYGVSQRSAKSLNLPGQEPR